MQKEVNEIIIGALVNAAAILIGGAIGLVFTGRISDRISVSITRALGLCIIIIGSAGALKGDLMLLVASLALGTLIGELVDIDKRQLIIHDDFLNKQEYYDFRHSLFVFLASTLKI